MKLEASKNQKLRTFCKSFRPDIFHTLIKISTSTVATTVLSTMLQPNLSHTTQHNLNCTPQHPGYGPTPSSDDIWSFYSSPAMASLSNTAHTPPNYIVAFSSLKASYTGPNYLGYFELKSHNPVACSQRCDAWGKEYGHTDTCRAFNIYVERSSSLHLGEECQDAPARTVIKCALWGSEVSER